MPRLYLLLPPINELMGEEVPHCTWKKIDGHYQCQAKECKHWLNNGVCQLGKVSLSCDNNECKHNIEVSPGIYRCAIMDVHLNADGKCISYESRRI